MSDRGRSPGGSGPGGRGPSQSPGGSRTNSPARSATPGSSLQEKWPQGPGYDPARSSNTQQKGNTRMELPPDAYVSETKKDLFTLRGNKFNTEGKLEKVEVNQYRMTKFDFSKKIYQYDIALSPEPLKRGPVMKKIMRHETFTNALARYKGDKWLFDGRKLAWAPVLIDRGQLTVRVDLDAGQDRAGKSNIFDVTIRNTTEIKVAALRGYLDHQTAFTTTVQEALNFLDHLVRQWPSQHMLAIKRNFYRLSEAGIPLGGDGGVVEVHKGSYVSVRMSHNFAQGGVGLGYNIDVANTCFWIGKQTLDQMMLRFLATCDPARWSNKDMLQIAGQLKPVRDGNKLQSSDAFKQLRKLRKLKFTVRHANRRNDNTVFTIYDFAYDERYGPDGGNARNVTFEYNGQQVSVAQYYLQKYKVTLRHSLLPVIVTCKGKKISYFPMELAFVEPMQRYPYKLNPDQTAAMIKIAVTRPNQRKQDIQKNVTDLQIGADPFLREYGVSFETQFAKTDARILPAPVVKFGQGTADPKFAGRWDLRGKKFWKPNEAPLANWGFVVLERDVPLPALTQFANTFKATFLGHGGKCTSDAQLFNPPGNMKHNAADAIAWAFDKLVAKGGYPQLLFCVVSRKNSGTYERLKKSADCRFGILTQVVLGSHVMKNNGQYHSNVSMKVNAKLGGATACTPQLWKTPTYFPQNRPTMLIGVDVSHGAPGGNSPSTAAMTMSIDPDGVKYAAMVESNGYRVEMLTPANIQKMFKGLGAIWKNGHNGGNPAHIIYFRDGVGEGQFAQVLDNEIGGMKQFLSQVMPGKALPKFTVIVATKRHHIRFFPQRGDKNGNPLPGTLVEKEVTHPFMFDFYLCSHVAIQGTARPVHYHVIHDEMNMPVNELQKMIYQQCYSYARSTTPVSLHPAVYYAHLASARARAHENIPTSDGFRAGPKGHEMIRDKVAKGLSVGGQRLDEAPPLLELGGRIPDVRTAKDGEIRQRTFFRKTMWYI